MKSYVEILNEMYEHQVLKENPVLAAAAGGVARAVTDHVLKPKPEGQIKQEDSLDQSETAGAKIDQSLRENYKKIIQDGVAHMVESNCDHKSPLTYQEGYQMVREYADNKLRELEEPDISNNT